MKISKIVVNVLIFVFLLSPIQMKSSNSIASEYLAQSEARRIIKVERVSVDSPVGTVPRLPFQIRVTYSDGKSEFRQVKWSNSARNVEEEQSNPDKYSVGKTYKIEGFVIGDRSEERRVGKECR